MICDWCKVQIQKTKSKTKNKTMKRIKQTLDIELISLFSFLFFFPFSFLSNQQMWIRWRVYFSFAFRTMWVSLRVWTKTCMYIFDNTITKIYKGKSCSHRGFFIPGWRGRQHLPHRQPTFAHQDNHHNHRYNHHHDLHRHHHHHHHPLPPAIITVSLCQHYYNYYTIFYIRQVINNLKGG